MSPPLQPDRLSIVLVNTRNPLNIGAVARAMSNFGFTDLRLVRPFEASFREARSAVGASEILANAQEHSSIAEAVDDCALVVGTTAASRRELQHPLRPLEEGGRLIRAGVSLGRAALLFGSEKRGLSNEDFSYCHWLLRIPTCEEHASMNLGQAVAVCLYEMSRNASPLSKRKSHRERLPGTLRQPDHPDIELSASSRELERITTMLLDALRASGYLEGRPSAKADEKIRRVVRRLRLCSGDAELLLGMLRQMLWKMRK